MTQPRSINWSLVYINFFFSPVMLQPNWLFLFPLTDQALGKLMAHLLIISFSFPKNVISLKIFKPNTFCPSYFHLMVFFFTTIKINHLVTSILHPLLILYIKILTVWCVFLLFLFTSCNKSCIRARNVGIDHHSFLFGWNNVYCIVSIQCICRIN